MGRHAQMSERPVARRTSDLARRLRGPRALRRTGAGVVAVLAIGSCLTSGALVVQDSTQSISLASDTSYSGSIGSTLTGDAARAGTTWSPWATSDPSAAAVTTKKVTAKVRVPWALTAWGIAFKASPKPSTGAPAPTSTPAPSSSSGAPTKAPSTSSPTTQAPAPSTPASSAPATSSGPGVNLAPGTWMSGASGIGDTNGQFGAWRGTPVQIVGTWADADDANQRRVYTVTGGSGTFSGPVDVAVGALVKGETWSQAANGAYDARWRESLGVMAQARKGKGQTFIRFAHEMNGNWYPWSVNAGNSEDFKKAWIRYRAIQKQVFPEAKLVFSVNRESVSSGIDWRKTFPGAAYVDVMGVDYYNQYPSVNSASSWADSLKATDGYGAPKGLDQHLAFAKSQGLPLSINEWSGAASQGDNPVYMQLFHDWLKKNGGSGAGQLLYEIVFNVEGYECSFQLMPNTCQPNAAAAYRQYF